MKKYEVTNRPAGFGPGAILGLTDDQADARAHALTRKGKGKIYTVEQPVIFKIGEVIGVEGKLSRAMEECLQKPAAKTKPGTDKGAVKSKDSDKDETGTGKGAVKPKDSDKDGTGEGGGNENG